MVQPFMFVYFWQKILFVTTPQTIVHRFDSVLGKNAIKVERFNNFSIGLRQNAKNTLFYHIYWNESDLRTSIERLYKESVVAYVEWLLFTRIQASLFFH